MKIARVVLYGDFDSGIERKGAHVFADAYRVSNASLDAAFAPAVVSTSEIATCDIGAQGFCDAKGQLEMIFCASELRVVSF